jgi:hypothetical protein
LLCYLAETGEPLAAILRPGNTGANTASDHFEVLQLALEQLPPEDLHREILARADIGGRTHAFTQDCRDAGIRFSVGYEVDERVREAILALPNSAWEKAIDADGKERKGAQVAELTDHVNLSSWPDGTRLIVRRERPHPGAQFEVFDAHGFRHTAFITDQDRDDIAALELRHRHRAKVEDEIRTGKQTGMAKMPFAAFEHNQAWLEGLAARPGDPALEHPALPGRGAVARRAQADSPAPSARRRADRALGQAHRAGAGALLALGRGLWSRPSPDCGRCRSLWVHSGSQLADESFLDAPPISPCSQTDRNAPIRR